MYLSIVKEEDELMPLYIAGIVSSSRCRRIIAIELKCEAVREYHELGFVDEPGRMLVMMTRAKHANIMYGNTASMFVKKSRRELDLIWAFNAAKAPIRRNCHTIPSATPTCPGPYPRRPTRRQ